MAEENGSSLQMDNETWAEGEEPYKADMDVIYRAVSTTIHTLIFVMGFVGNTVLIFVVYKSKSLHTSLYAYLVSDNAKIIGKTLAITATLR